jgi:hypothetical protein
MNYRYIIFNILLTTKLMPYTTTLNGNIRNALAKRVVIVKEDIVKPLE